MEYTREYPIKRLRGQESNIEEDLLVVEYPFTIFIDDKEILTLLCTPKSLRELVIGFLHSEGFINNMDSLARIEIDEKAGRAYVDLRERNSFNEEFYGKRTLTSGCGKGTVFYNVVDSFKSKKISRKLEVNVDKIRAFMRDFHRQSEIFQATGGVHSCGLYDQEGMLIFEEDIGRHNALDKVLGRALEEGIDLTDKMILTSGRISSEIIIKVAKRSIPIIISRAAPTSLAIDIGKELGISLIGFVRGEKMNLYTNFD